MVFSKNTLGLDPDKFWKLTFGEFWPLYNMAMAKVERPFSKRDLNRLNARYLDGGFGGVSNKSSC
jgi:hypothetical protein